MTIGSNGEQPSFRNTISQTTANHMPFGSQMQSTKDTRETEAAQEGSSPTNIHLKNSESPDAVEPRSAESFTAKKDFCLKLYLKPVLTTTDQ